MDITCKFTAPSGEAVTEMDTTWERLTSKMLDHFTTEKVMEFHHTLFDGETVNTTLRNGIKVTLIPFNEQIL